MVSGARGGQAGSRVSAEIRLDCTACDAPFVIPVRRGRPPLYCSPACKERAAAERKKALDERVGLSDPEWVVPFRDAMRIES